MRTRNFAGALGQFVRTRSLKYKTLPLAPVGYGDPMYVIVNLAMGSKWFGGIGVIDGESPQMVEFEIDRISVYQIDPSSP